MLSLARSKHPRFEYNHEAAEELSLPDYEVRNGQGGFDAITMVNVVGELVDVLAAFSVG